MPTPHRPAAPPVPAGFFLQPVQARATHERQSPGALGGPPAVGPYLTATFTQQSPWPAMVPRLARRPRADQGRRSGGHCRRQPGRPREVGTRTRLTEAAARAIRGDMLAARLAGGLGRGPPGLDRQARARHREAAPSS